MKWFDAPGVQFWKSRVFSRKTLPLPPMSPSQVDGRWCCACLMFIAVKGATDCRSGFSGRLQEVQGQ